MEGRNDDPASHIVETKSAELQKEIRNPLEGFANMTSRSQAPFHRTQAIRAVRVAVQLPALHLRHFLFETTAKNGQKKERDEMSATRIDDVGSYFVMKHNGIL